MNRYAITNLVLDTVIFDARWFKRLDKWVDADCRKRGAIGQAVFIIPFVITIMLLCLFRLADAEAVISAE